MALYCLINCLSDADRVGLMKLYASLGGDVKELECTIAELERQNRSVYNAKEDIAKIMSESPHYRGKPG